jgi:hypothetical protein
MRRCAIDAAASAFASHACRQRAPRGDSIASKPRRVATAAASRPRVVPICARSVQCALGVRRSSNSL